MSAHAPVDPLRRLVLAGSGALMLGTVGAIAAAGPKPRVIPVVAKKFVFVPAEIQVAKGEAVELHITAPEVPMGFSLPDFRQRVDVMPGQVATLAFTPDRAGQFGFVCDLFCGSGHEDMQGTLVVT